jgi:hypothetical protein
MLRFVQDAVSYTVKGVATDKAKSALVVAGATVNGIRRVARFDLSIDTLAHDVLFALVYLPEGMQTDNMNLMFSEDAAASIYVPEQHVIMSGVASVGSAGRFFSYQSRSLASGDQIYFLARAFGDASDVYFRCSFVVAFG